jgi:large subunit ribosomal protein L9
VADELTKQGFPVERKRVELPGNSFKSVGKYKVTVKLYESAAAELTITVEGQPVKVETPSSAPARGGRRRRDAEPAEAKQETAGQQTAGQQTEGQQTAGQQTESLTDQQSGEGTAAQAESAAPAVDAPETAAPDAENR